MWLVLLLIGVAYGARTGYQAYLATLPSKCNFGDWHHIRIKDCTARSVRNESGSRLGLFMTLLNRTLEYHCPQFSELEFCVGLGDRNEEPLGVPVLVHAKRAGEEGHSHLRVTVPTCFFGGWPAKPEGDDPVLSEFQSYEDMYYELINAAKVNPWSSRENKLFWRGRELGLRRELLAPLQAHQHADVAFVKDDDPQTLPWMIANHTRYKYLIDVDRGHGFSERQPFLFLTGAVLLVHDTFLHHYSKHFTPWIHYVPVPKGADAAAILQTLMADEEQAASIARHGWLRAMEILGPGALYLELSHTLAHFHQHFQPIRWKA